MSFWEDLGNSFVDLHKVGFTPFANAIESVSGRKIDMALSSEWAKTYSTNRGKFSDFYHGIGKTIGNSVTMGYASKLTNSWRPDYAKEGDGTSLLKGKFFDNLANSDKSFFAEDRSIVPKPPANNQEIQTTENQQEQTPPLFDFSFKNPLILAVGGLLLASLIFFTIKKIKKK